MNDKLILKDYIGQNDINIKVHINIKGEKYESSSIDNNIRILKRVYTKKDYRGLWLFIEWQPEGQMEYQHKNTIEYWNDCGYSGVLIYESDGNPCENHPIDNLYLNIA